MKNQKKPKPSFRYRRHRLERPIHKRLVLHPFSVLVLLCVGIIFAASTWQAHADTIDVSAKVSAPLPAESAIITSPHDQQHVVEATIDVVGTCPDNTYVKLYRNGSFSGVAQCQGGHFTILTSLSLGANQLQARVYNATDDEGPASSPITVYRDEKTTAPSLPGSQGASAVNPYPSSPNVSGGAGSLPLSITGDYNYQLHYTAEPFTWKLQAVGGVGPYRIIINWGDGQTTSFESKDGVLQLSHAYSKGGNYQPIIQVTDGRGSVVTLQLSAVVKDRPIIAANTVPFASEIQRYLGILWPAYVAILLMLVSFWLGELEIVHYIWTHKVRGKQHAKRRHA